MHAPQAATICMNRHVARAAHTRTAQSRSNALQTGFALGLGCSLGPFPLRGRSFRCFSRLFCDPLLLCFPFSLPHFGRSPGSLYLSLRGSLRSLALHSWFHHCAPSLGMYNNLAPSELMLYMFVTHIALNNINLYSLGACIAI